MPYRTRSYLTVLIVGGIIISLCMGVRQSLGLFMGPITRDIGVTAGAFGFSIALQNIVWGFTQPIVGAIADRFGPRPVLITTGLVFATGLLVMGGSNGELGLDLAGFLIGLGIAGTGFGVIIGVVTRATPLERQSRTVGAVSAAGSLGTIIIAPLGQMMIDNFGWRGGLYCFAGIALLMTVLSFFIRDQPASPGTVTPARRQTLGEALRIVSKHRGFIMMTIAYFACGFQLVFIITNLPQYLELCGVSPGLSATAIGLIGVFNTIGTYGFGVAGGRYSQKRLLAMIYLLRSIAITVFVLTPATPTSTLVFAAVLGLLWLGVAPLITGILSRMFGMTHFNMLFGLSFLSHQLGSFVGAWMGGWVFDFTGNYDWAWAALVTIGGIAFTLQWTMDDRPATPGPGLRGAPAAA